MPNVVTQRMFSLGEVDVELYKRADSEGYLTGAQSLLNMEVGVTGLCKKRKGTKFLLNVTSQVDINSQLYEYVDKNQNYFIIMSAPSGTGWWAFPVNSNGTIGIPINITGTPYTSAELPFVDYALTNDSLVLSHPNYPPARIYISTYPNTFTYQVLQIAPYYPVYDFGTINYNAFTAAFTNPTSTTFQLVLTGTGAGNFTTDWINGQIVAVGADPTQPLGYGIITAVTPGVNTVTFVGNVVVPFASPSNMPTVGSQYSIRQPAWSASLGYPTCVAFYQNRLWFANTPNLPSTMFGSVLNQPVSFNVGVGGDTDAIVYSIGQTNAGQILWMNGGKQLEIYSENFEFACPQNEGSGLTPSTFAVRQQSSYGAHDLIKPITYINDSYYVAKNGNAIINFHFNGIGLTYQSSNISLQSQHLVKSPHNRAILRADSVSQDNFIYYLNPDSTITAFQFASEFKLAALTPIDFNTNPNNNIGVFDVCSVNNVVYMLKSYSSNNIFALEQFDEEVRVDSWFPATMDSAGNVTTLSVPLTNLNGYFVSVTFTNNGLLQDLGVSKIVNGVLVADNPNGYSGTVMVGLLYTVDLRPMYITPGSTKYKSASGSVYDFKSLNRIYVDYVNSLDFYINGTHVDFWNFNQIQASDSFAIAPKTDSAIISVQAGWNRFFTFDITQESPFDLKITGISYQIVSNLI